MTAGDSDLEAEINAGAVGVRGAGGVDLEAWRRGRREGVGGVDLEFMVDEGDRLGSVETGTRAEIGGGEGVRAPAPRIGGDTEEIGEEGIVGDADGRDRCGRLRMAIFFLLQIAKLRARERGDGS